MGARGPVAVPRPVGLPPTSLGELAALVGGEVRTAGDGTSSEAVAADPAAVRVSGVTLRSDDVRAGDLFAALPGSAAHGATYTASARAAGAVAVLTDPAGYTLLGGADPAVPVIVAAEPRRGLGALAARIYGDPSRRLQIIGVTGTSGKTTTTYLIEAALRAAGRTPGLIGTVTTRIDGADLPSMLTTPEATDLQALLAVMAQRGVDTVAMEVSSHALALGRVGGTSFAVGAFTNLSQDHLDFHADMEDYFAAKLLLFDGRAAREVVVIDDDHGRRLAALRPAAATVSRDADTGAHWYPTHVAAAPSGQRMTVHGPGGVAVPAAVALPGSFNVTNAVCALAAVAAAGVDPAAAAPGLAAVRVPGRMERIDAGQPFLVVVDYAHKPAALAVVLAAVRGQETRRVIAVVGAGGDRDRGKRPHMGRIAAESADLVIVTDDNPRSEEPAAIRAELLAGARAATGGAEIREAQDRRAAIVDAVAAARPGDVVVIAGKGHESGQDIGGVVHHFDDREEARAALAARGYR